MQMLDREDDTSLLVEPKACSATQQNRDQWEMEDLKKESLDISMAKVQEFSSLIADKDEGHNLVLAINSVSKGFQEWNNGSARRSKLDCQRKSNSMEHPCQELSEKNEKRESAAVSRKFASHSSACKHINKSKIFSPALSNGCCWATSDVHCVAENIGTALKKSAGTSWGEVPSFAMIPSVFSWDNKKISPSSPLQAIIKPKDVIHAVGQQLFWKARKAIVRQQEIFTNQVFELHKLIEVQKLLAKLPSTLIEDPQPSSKGSPGFAGALDPEGDYNKEHAISIKGAQKATAPCNSGVEGHEPNPQQKLQTHQDQAAAKSQQTNRWSFLHSLTKGSCGQAPCPSITEGTATWGYPIGPLNRPFLYPPIVGPFSPGSGVGAAYVLGSGPSLPPFPFPCYAPRPEQVDPCFGFNNQWPNPLLHGSVLTPLPYDWFAMNHPSQVPHPSCSEKLGLPNSVPSINMKAEASSQSVRPSMLSLLSQPQQVGVGNDTTMKAANLAGTAASAGLSTQQGLKSEKPVAPGDADDSSRNPNSKVANRVMPQGLGSCVGKTKALIKERGTSKESSQILVVRRQGTMDREPSFQENALDLFPLQPSGTAACAEDEVGCGRIIKVIPRSAQAALESAAVILRSIQQERQS